MFHIGEMEMRVAIVSVVAEKSNTEIVEIRRGLSYLR